MDIQHLMLAYTAAVLVALGITASFSASISQMLLRLLQEDIATHWSRFLRFALFAVSAAGGMPERSGGFIDRNGLPPPPPTTAEGLMLVMNSAVGSLMAASWFLLLFFGVTLTALTAGRLIAARQQRKHEEAREVAKLEEVRKREESERRSASPKPEGEPAKRMEPAEARPVATEKKPEFQPPLRKH